MRSKITWVVDTFRGPQRWRKWLQARSLRDIFLKELRLRNPMYRFRGSWFGWNELSIHSTMKQDDLLDAELDTWEYAE